MDIFYPVESFAGWITFSVLSLDSTTTLAQAINFFIYDSIKIIILLFVITFIMGVINIFLPVEKVRDFLLKNKLFGFEYLLAALFGTATPFCSCSSIPLFIGFVKGGIPLGVTFAFLISSPLVDSVVIAMLLGLFGLKVTLVYVVTGIVISMLAGFVLGRMKLERYLEPWVLKVQSANSEIDRSKESYILKIIDDSLATIKIVFPYIFIGVGLSSFIHGYVPTEFFTQYVRGFWSVPVATIIAVPLYANAAGVLPIGQALVSKGIPIGTVLSFMMAAVALSIPSSIMLKKVMNWKLLIIFLGVVTFAIILSGYFFNIVLG
jgi:hypothetical protein